MDGAFLVDGLMSGGQVYFQSRTGEYIEVWHDIIVVIAATACLTTATM